MTGPCTCSVWWVDPDTGTEYDQGGGDRVRMYSEPDPECPVHAVLADPVTAAEYRRLLAAGVSEPTARVLALGAAARRDT